MPSLTELFPTFAKALHMGRPAPRELTEVKSAAMFGAAGGYGNAFWQGHEPGSRRNWAQEAGEPWKNSTVFACLGWVTRTFPEAPLGVQPVTGGAIDHAHPLAALIRRPNPAYGRTTLWAATALSYLLDGNAYWFKARDGAGRVRELWYRPHWQVTPVRLPGSKNFIDYYAYRVGNLEQRMAPEDVVHLRDGIDPDNELSGLGRMKALLRTVATDNTAANITAALLRNWGVPGATITPKDGTPAPTREQADAIKNSFTARATGDAMGTPIVFAGQYDISYPDPNLDGAALTAIKHITQADIAAALGVPAVVVGLLVGLETSTAKASYEDARRQAYESLLVPLQTSISEDIDLQLMPDFDPSATLETAFDYTSVSVLNEGAGDIAERWGQLYQTGICTRGEAREKVGLEPRPDDDVFAVVRGETLVDEADQVVPGSPNDPAAALNAGRPAQAPQMNGNGNGRVPVALTNGRNGNH